MKKTRIRQMVGAVLREELASMLHDVSYRLSVLDNAQNGGKFGSRDLNLASHMIDGYTVTDDSPSAGSIAWVDVNIAYKGVTYDITDGNTNKKYVWWDFSATPNTTLQTSDTKPTLAEDDVLVFVNDAGKHQTAMTTGKMISGSTLTDGTVTGAEIKALTILAGNLATDSVTSTKIQNGAVVSGKLGESAVGSTNLADGSVVAAKVGAGQVSADKLNTAQHMLY